jgi:hypothetical protein
VPLFRREKLHERLAREAGMLHEDPPQPDPRPAFETGIHGLQQPRRWDAVVMTDALDIEPSELEFVALADGMVVLEHGLEDARIEPLVEAGKTVVKPPFRAQAVRRSGRTWAVAVRAIEVLHLPNTRGQDLTLTMHDGSRTLTVDGRPEFGSVPALERTAEQRHDSYVARATRIRGDLWEVAINPL